MTKGKRSCWAAELGNCAGKRTREHVISESVLRIARGMHPDLALARVAWDERLLPTSLSSATVRHLCGKHNSQLSPLDAEAARLTQFIVDAVEPFTLPTRVAAIGAGREPILEGRFDGCLLERWALKTCLNDFAARGNTAPPDGATAPSGRHVLETVFTGAPPPTGHGMYELVVPKKRERPGTALSVEVVEVKRTTPAGEVLRFPAFFVINLGPLQVAIHANVTALSDADWTTEVSGFWAAGGGRPMAVYHPPSLTMAKRRSPGLPPCRFARARLDWR
ncbi:MAG: hypothetical protein JWN63_229 [Candidatus Acidoferrum typicum]|nr:hypothetical protein [Candidatus Acidoferrum typicum]